ncbi:MAG: hypothetical protein PHG27_04475 [Massilibacteroides sp.]|nr:hypothetical protein [Massilibacteroides sp.]
MELEEMKKVWQALSEKLDQKEKLSGILIHEMYKTKVKKSVNILVGYEILSAVICLLALPIIGWVFFANTHWLFRFSKLYWGLFSLTGAIWSAAKANLLSKLDEVGDIKNNIKVINTYAVWIRKEKLYLLLPVVIGTIPLTIIYWLYAKPWHWVFMFALFALAIFVSLWSYKRLYDRNIRNIQQNLNELAELDD